LAGLSFSQERVPILHSMTNQRTVTQRPRAHTLADAMILASRAG
jgi:hypothetical protein